MNALDNLWVSEYSASQNAFNIDTLGQVLKTNTLLIQNRENNDYLIFGIFDTSEKANIACNKMRRKQQQKQLRDKR